MPYLAALPHLQQRVGGGEELCHFLLQSYFCTPHTDLLSVVHLAILSCFFHCDCGDKEEHSWVLLLSLYTILVFLTTCFSSFFAWSERKITFLKVGMMYLLVFYLEITHVCGM